MGIMHLSTVDKYLTAVVALAAIADVPIPTAWVDAQGVDIMQLELWSTAAWTLQDLDGGAEIEIPADTVIVLAVRINLPKLSTSTIFRASGSANLNILAHALKSAYADQG